MSDFSKIQSIFIYLVKKFPEVLLLMADSSMININGIGPVLFEHSKRARRVIISIRPSIGIKVAVPTKIPFKNRSGICPLEGIMDTKAPG